MMAWLLIMLYLILIAPVQGGVILSAGNGPVHGVIGAAVWGVIIQGRYSLLRDEEGQLRLESSFRRKKRKHPKDRRQRLQKIFQVLRALLRANFARKLLRQGLHLQCLNGDIFLHLDDAAHTALVSSLLQALSGLSAKTDIRIHPSFMGPSALRIKCIVRFRLGILLIACLMGLISYRLSGKKEETAWNIPSDT